VLEWSDIILRLGVATLGGGLIGLNRDLQGKPIGLKTLGIVGLSTATVVVVAVQFTEVGKITDATSRVIQGILTGIGFLGAGVIVHQREHFRVRGLTSAACAFLTACIGIVSGAGEWRIVATALVIALVLLTVGRRTEDFLHHALGGHGDPGEQDAPVTPPPGRQTD
jgi:putative Mg2+ transporter-C (MgtC) family protein